MKSPATHNKQMGALNKSFLLGTAVASVTWCISLYLYWILVHNAENDIDSSTMIPKQSHRPFNSINDLSPHNEKLSAKDISKMQYLDKVKRYKKEQKLKKFSRKLIDELQPIASVGNGRFTNEKSAVASGGLIVVQFSR